MLEASERRYRTIIDTIPLAIAEINRDGIVNFANAATEKMYRLFAGGTRRQRTCDRNKSDLPVKHFGPGSSTPCRNSRHRARSSAAGSIKTASGSIFGATGTTCETKRRGHWPGHRRRRHHRPEEGGERIAKSKAILTAVIESLPFDLFALAPDGRCILQNVVSRQYYGSFGKTTEEVCPDDRILARWLEKHRRAFAGERVEGEVELVIGGDNAALHNIITPIRRRR